MKKKNIISRFFSVMLLISVFSAHVMGNLYVQPEVTKKAKADTEKQQEQPQLQQLSHEIVVPSFDFHFGEITFQGFNNLVIFYAECVPGTIIQQFVYHHCFFDKLFEHHIAINAP